MNYHSFYQNAHNITNISSEETFTRIKQIPDYGKLSLPGVPLIVDFRPQTTTQLNSNSDSNSSLQTPTTNHSSPDSSNSNNTNNNDPPNLKPLKYLTWNIERGYHLDYIIKTLKNINADIIALQELDIGCIRSQKRDCFREIAFELQMIGVYITEFIEIHDTSLRSLRDGGGGVHGNCILSKYPLQHIRSLHHTFHPIHWEKWGHLKREPRQGERFTVVAQILTPAGGVWIYSVHLEVFCGITSRLAMMADIMKDVRDRMKGKSKDYSPVAIMGDFNTLAHG